MLKARLLTALVGIPLLLVLAYLGGIYWILFIMALAGIGLSEFYAMASAGGYNPVSVLGYLLTISWLTLSASIPAVRPEHIQILFVVFLALTGMVLIGYYPHRKVVDLAITWFGALYLGILLSYAILIDRQFSGSFHILLLVFLLAWASDTGGYFAGRSLGRRKLAPGLSPNKTWEGAIGGLILAMAVALVYEWGKYPIIHSILLGAAAGILAQAGDLVASSMKRCFGVKDSGKIIPGHGGVLDRFDSFLWVLPLVYYFFKGL